MKKFERCTTTINGRSYTAQFNGTREYPRGLDLMNNEITGLRSNERTVEYLFKNVLVEPANFDIDSVTPKELDEICSFLLDIFRGRDDAYIKAEAKEAKEENKKQAVK